MIVDTCCAEPAPEKFLGAWKCINCRLAYDEHAWECDPRVTRARLDSRRFSREQTKIIDMIKSDPVDEI